MRSGETPHLAERNGVIDATRLGLAGLALAVAPAAATLGIVAYGVSNMFQPWGKGKER